MINKKKFALASCKALEGEDRLVELIISTSELDRDKDRLSAKGCIFNFYLENNPVCLKDHRWNTDNIIAKCLSIVIDGELIRAIVKFPALGKIKESDETYIKIKEDLLKAVSVGYLIKAYTRNDSGGLNISEWEILEISFVAIGANAGAGVTVKGANGNEEIQELITSAVKNALEPVLKKLEALENEALANKIAEEMGIDE